LIAVPSLPDSGLWTKGIGARSWFCDPSVEWQKGALENASKRLRRFMPGATDLAAVSQRDLIQLARHLNDKPRKCLGYNTPAEVFMAHCRMTRDLLPCKTGVMHLGLLQTARKCHGSTWS
jgi:hypothetical protein